MNTIQNPNTTSSKNDLTKEKEEYKPSETMIGKSPTVKKAQEQNPAKLSAEQRLERPERIPVYKQKRHLLGIKPRNGYHRRVEIKKEDINDCLRAGYSVVLEDGSAKKVLMNRSKGEYGTLLEIPQKYFDEDQLGKTEEPMRRVKQAATPNPQFRQYVPDALKEMAD